jgi:aspartyl-tRNA(Asn)/glutamyl-tRNA(Gln) amidotransferase subunit C
MAISREDVAKVSKLGRLLLAEQELDRMTVQLGAILQYMDLLSEVDTSRIEPMAHPLDVSDVLRLDEVRPSLDRAEAMAGAPHHDAECYLVPAVLGEP